MKYLIWPIMALFAIFKNFSIKKKLVVIVIFLIIFILGFNVITNALKQPEYITAQVTLGDLTEIVSESGAISTDSRTDIYSPTNGIIDEVFVSNGDQINQGQELFTVKSTATDDEKKTAYANYQAALIALKQAENTLRDKTAILDTVLDDVKDHDDDETFAQKQARTTAEVAKDNAFDAVKIADAQLVALQIAYQATQNATVKAPIAGTVSNLSIVLGSGVSINTVLAPVRPVLTIGNLSTTEVILSLSENDIIKVKENQEVKIDVDAINNKLYKGIVKRVDTFGTDVSGVVKYNVYIEVLNPDENLRPGMTADADIITKRLTDILSVPNSAVKPYQGSKAVRVPTDKKNETKLIPVKVGIRGSERTQILEGLSEGEIIILALSNDQVERKGPFGF